MNIIKGVIESIHSSELICVISVRCSEVRFTAVTLQLDPSFAPGVPVEIQFNDAEVSFSKGQFESISIANNITGTVSSVRNSELLSAVEITTGAGSIQSLVLSDFITREAIADGCSVTVHIRGTDIGLVAC